MAGSTGTNRSRTDLPLNSNVGGVGVILGIVLLVISLSVLSYALIHIYKDIKKTEKMEEEVYLEAVEVTREPEQIEIVTSLKRSLTSSMEENLELSKRIEEFSAEVERLKKDIDIRTVQIGRFSAQRTRMDVSMRNQASRFDERIKKANAEIGQFKKALDHERIESEKLKTSLSGRIEDLEKELKGAEAKRQQLVKVLARYQKGRMVRETAKMHYNLANLFVEQKKYKIAIKEYLRVIKLYPNDAEAHYNLALVYDIHTNDIASAVKHYKRCLEMNPRFRRKRTILERISTLELDDAVRIHPTVATGEPKYTYEPDAISITPPRSADEE